MTEFEKELAKLESRRCSACRGKGFYPEPCLTCGNTGFEPIRPLEYTCNSCGMHVTNVHHDFYPSCLKCAVQSGEYRRRTEQARVHNRAIKEKP